VADAASEPALVRIAASRPPSRRRRQARRHRLPPRAERLLRRALEARHSPARARIPEMSFRPGLLPVHWWPARAPLLLCAKSPASWLAVSGRPVSAHRPRKRRRTSRAA